MINFLISLFIFMMLHPIWSFIIIVFILNLFTFKYYTTHFEIYETIRNTTDDDDYVVYFVDVKIIYKSTLFKVYWTKRLKNNDYETLCFREETEAYDRITTYKWRRRERFENQKEQDTKLIKIIE